MCQACRFVSTLQNDVSNLSTSLIVLGASLEEFAALQRAWMHLDPIFRAHDIQRQLPDESKRFNGVDQSFKKIVHAIADRPNVMHSFSDAALLQTLKECNEAMEHIQASATHYYSLTQHARRTRNAKINTRSDWMPCCHLNFG